MMSELTIRAFLNDGGKLKKVKADKKIMDKANELIKQNIKYDKFNK